MFYLFLKYSKSHTFTWQSIFFECHSIISSSSTFVFINWKGVQTLWCICRHEILPWFYFQLIYFLFYLVVLPFSVCPAVINSFCALSPCLVINIESTCAALVFVLVCSVPLFHPPPSSFCFPWACFISLLLFPACLLDFWFIAFWFGSLLLRQIF